MRDAMKLLQECIEDDRVELVEHAYDQMVARHIDPEDAIRGAWRGRIVEDYRVTRGEARVLVRQQEAGDSEIETVWDLPLGPGEPAILVTEGQTMTEERTIKRLREGQYLAEVEVELRQHPEREYVTLSLAGVRKLERVRKALAAGDLETAATEATLFVARPLDRPSSAA